MNTQILFKSIHPNVVDLIADSIEKNNNRFLDVKIKNPVVYENPFDGKLTASAEISRSSMKKMKSAKDYNLAKEHIRFCSTFHSAVTPELSSYSITQEIMYALQNQVISNLMLLGYIGLHANCDYGLVDEKTSVMNDENTIKGSGFVISAYCYQGLTFSIETNLDTKVTVVR
ncbi:hypothetical protein [Aliivibrio fischeri]|uniref:hypothetical protein n=1 Tax=Aliivibrio fischeri TaxID=668 RepID=UPI0012D9AAC9|nr:hypothetical protein [Aliivibrio fischeri]MUJ20410.1 hypothetical protein [Aliivibrio fischeri]